MLAGALIGLVVALVMMGIVYVSNRGKTGAEFLTKLPSRVMSISTTSAPDQVMAALSGGLPEAKAELTATDPNAKRLVLATPMSLATWGFWYPIHITPLANGGSQLDIGCKSRGFQWGPLVTAAHRNLVGMVQARVGAAPPVG